MKNGNDEKKFTKIDNVPPPLYGPPEDVLKKMEKETEEFSPELNIEPCVYAPPPMYDKKLKKSLFDVLKEKIKSKK